MVDWVYPLIERACVEYRKDSVGVKDTRVFSPL